MAGIGLGLAFASKLVSNSFSFIYAQLGLKSVSNLEALRLSYFWIMLLAGTFFVLFLNRLYPGALDCPSSLKIKRWKRELTIFLCAAPWIVSEMLKFRLIHSDFLGLLQATHGNSHQLAISKQTIHKAYLTVWQPMGWGVDCQAIVLAVLMSILFPIFEERFFRGYMLNRLCQRFQPLVAVIVTSFVFMAAHLFVVKSSGQLLWILFMGFNCGLVRLVSGKWTDALALHLLINFLIFLPKLYVAGVNFLILSH